MSRWLKNVGTFLEQLDGKAEKAYEIDLPPEDEPLEEHEKETAVDASQLVEEVPADASDEPNDSNEERQDPFIESVPKDIVLEFKSESVAPDAESVGNAAAATPSSRPSSVQDTPFMTPAQTENFSSALEEPRGGDALNDKIELTVVESLKREIERLKAEHAKAVANHTKESKTLRRHIAKLSDEVKAADTELEHQRKELEDAAIRLEKDRKLNKEKILKSENDKKEALQALEKTHEKILKETKERYEQEFYEVQQRLESLQHQRKLEGGESDNLLMDAQARESELLRKVDFLEQEKETLLSQLDILQKNQESLGSRLENSMETAESATAREREAEQRLDEALELHGKQVTQRQQREAELEQRLAELTDALVAERNKSQQQVPGDETAQTTEVETLHNVIDQERQQQLLLRKQLHDLSKERMEEAELAQKRQQRLERKIAELDGRIETLKAAPPTIVKEEADPEIQKRVKSLSEEVVSQRHKITSANSEITALRTRLSVALNRATVAEAAAESNANDHMVRRQTMRTKKPMPSLKSAIGLESPFLDAVDSFLMKSGKLLRYNPFARLFFVLYLIVLHFWTLALLFFHAHNFDVLHDTYTLGHGPAAVAHGNLRASGGG